MENKKKRIVIALGGNALGNTLPEQMIAVKITAKAIVDLIEEGCEVIVAHGNCLLYTSSVWFCHPAGPQCHLPGLWGGQKA